MRLAVSGTPGTGKSSAAKILARKLGYGFTEANDIAERAGAVKSYDRKRKSWIVDVKKLGSASKNLKGNWIIAGHLSHFCSVDRVLILRTRPDVLRARLAKKGWSKRKIEENVEAEIIDAISQEAVKRHGRKKVLEFDTTGKRPQEVAKEIIKVLKGKSLADHRPGKIDWTRFLGEEEGTFG